MNILKKIYNWFYKPLNNEDWNGTKIDYQPTNYTNNNWVGLFDGTKIHDIKEIETVYYWIRRNIIYKNDVDDEWQTPAETISKRTGDCEDMAILLCSLTDDNVRVALGRINDKPHAYNIWFRNDGKIILIDITGSGEWKEAKYTVEYKIFYSFNRFGIWKHF